jgi:vancomycin resistance protein YoaR
VAYGYKDLKVKNTSNQPLAFSFEISKDKITLHVHSNKPMDALDVSFAPEEASDNRVAVSTWVNGKKVAHSDYGLPK